MKIRYSFALFLSLWIPIFGMETNNNKPIVPVSLRKKTPPVSPIKSKDLRYSPEKRFECGVGLNASQRVLDYLNGSPDKNFRGCISFAGGPWLYKVVGTLNQKLKDKTLDSATLTVNKRILYDHSYRAMLDKFVVLGGKVSYSTIEHRKQQGPFHKTSNTSMAGNGKDNGGNREAVLRLSRQSEIKESNDLYDQGLLFMNKYKGDGLVFETPEKLKQEREAELQKRKSVQFKDFPDVGEVTIYSSFVTDFSGTYDNLLKEAEKDPENSSILSYTMNGWHPGETRAVEAGVPLKEIVNPTAVNSRTEKEVKELVGREKAEVYADKPGGKHLTHLKTKKVTVNGKTYIIHCSGNDVHCQNGKGSDWQLNTLNIFQAYSGEPYEDNFNEAKKHAIVVSPELKRFNAKYGKKTKSTNQPQGQPEAKRQKIDRSVASPFKASDLIAPDELKDKKVAHKRLIFNSSSSSSSRE